jgi:hypothetical protein
MYFRHILQGERRLMEKRRRMKSDPKGIKDISSELSEVTPRETDHAMDHPTLNGSKIGFETSYRSRPVWHALRGAIFLIYFTGWSSHSLLDPVLMSAIPSGLTPPILLFSQTSSLFVKKARFPSGLQLSKCRLKILACLRPRS